MGPGEYWHSPRISVLSRQPLYERKLQHDAPVISSYMQSLYKAQFNLIILVSNMHLFNGENTYVGVMLWLYAILGLESFELTEVCHLFKYF